MKRKTTHLPLDCCKAGISDGRNDGCGLNARAHLGLLLVDVKPERYNAHYIDELGFDRVALLLAMQSLRASRNEPLKCEKKKKKKAKI